MENEKRINNELISSSVLTALREKLEKENPTLNEVEDTFGDLFVASAKIEQQVPKKGQGKLNVLNLILAAAAQQENVVDIYESGEKFFEQLTSFTPDQIDESVKNAKARAIQAIGGDDLGKISGLIIKVVENLSSNNRYVRDNIEFAEKIAAEVKDRLITQGREQLNLWKNLRS